MNILITGGAGFIGQHITRKLLADTRAEKITILDNLSPQIHGDAPDIAALSNPKVRFLQADVRDKKALAQAIEGVNFIIHLASETGTGQSMYDITQYSEVNISGTANILDVLTNTKHTVKKVLLASSRSIYGEGRYLCQTHGDVFPGTRLLEDLQAKAFEPKCPVCKGKLTVAPTTEDSNINPISYYALTKRIQEEILQYGVLSGSYDYVILRLQNVYGPGQSLKNPYTGIISIFSNLMKLGKEAINIFEDGEESRDFVYVEDVADAFIKSMFDSNVKNKVMNIGSGKQTTVMEVAETLKKSLNSGIELKISGDFRLGDIRHNFADITEARNNIGFDPKFSFKEGIQKFVDWAKIQEAEKDAYNKSLNEMKEKGLMFSSKS